MSGPRTTLRQKDQNLKNCVCRLALVVIVAMFPCAAGNGADENPSQLELNAQDALEMHGLTVFLFHDSYHGVFGDEKMSGLEMVLHEQRIATNGDVRLSPTPAQWDAIPKFKEPSISGHCGAGIYAARFGLFAWDASLV
jgi:endoglucanase